MSEKHETERTLLENTHKNITIVRNDSDAAKISERNASEKIHLQPFNSQPKLPVFNDTNGKNLRSTRSGIFHQIAVTLAISILTIGSGMPLGYTAVFLPQIDNTTDPLWMDREMASWFASVHSLASPIGAFASGPIMDRYGRRPTLIMAMIPVILGWVLLATGTSHTVLLMGRLLAGLSGGFMGAPSQILIAECADPFLRGILINFSYVSYSIGILIIYTLGAVFHWRYVAWCGIILPIISIIVIVLSPESPSWLARNGQREKAAKVLRWLRGDDAAADSELHDIVKRFEQEKYEQKLEKESVWSACKERAALKPLLIVGCFQILLITSGTYIIVFYAVDIISDLGTSVDSMTAAVLTALMRLTVTIICCFTFFFMRRRTIYVSAGLGSGLSTTLLALYLLYRSGETKTTVDLYVGCILILIYIATNTGFMVAPGFMIGELLPAKIRGRIAGYIYAMFNITFFCLAKIFPHLKHYIKIHGVFLLFGVSSFLAAGLIYFMVPETKGKSLGEIEDYFKEHGWIYRGYKSNNNNKAKSIKETEKCLAQA